MKKENNQLFKSIKYSLIVVAFLWLVKITETLFSLSLSMFGNYPRTASGLVGIVTAPLVHSDYSHLISNSIPLLILGWGISYAYPKASKKLFVAVYFLHGLLIWLFARQAHHIGASGLVYGLVSFLFFSGIIRRDKRSVALALIVTFLYGGLTWGVLPIKAEISWEAHLFGSIVGIVFAFVLRKYDPPLKYDWENELDDSSSTGSVD